MNSHPFLLNIEDAHLIEMVQYYYLYLQRKGEMDIFSATLPSILTYNIQLNQWIRVLKQCYD